MYFPYFRGKRFELAMLKDTRDLINASEKIIPIIEPVKKKLNDLQSMLNNFQETKTPVIVIVNPRVGELLGADNSELRILIKESCEKNENLYVAFILGENIQFHDVQQFMNEFGQNNKVLIHTHSVENPQEIK
ncbi:MAG: sce7725 family protein, partial [Tissierellales bacterium]|nr:sce7725 family protein [Tissierellales bacterium]